MLDIDRNAGDPTTASRQVWFRVRHILIVSRRISHDSDNTPASILMINSPDRRRKTNRVMLFNLPSEQNAQDEMEIKLLVRKRGTETR